MEENRPVGVLLADDHNVMRKGIRALIEHYPEFRVVAEVCGGSEAIAFCKENPPDLAVIDIAMPGIDGIETIRELMWQNSKLRAVVLSMHSDERTVVRAMRAGARGFVEKSANVHELIEALRTVHRGGMWMSPSVSPYLMDRFRLGRYDDSPVSGALSALTHRETQVVRMVAEGLTTKEIAMRLLLSHETIRSYRKSAMKKLGVSSKSGLTRMAVSAGLAGNEANGEGRFTGQAQSALA